MKKAKELEKKYEWLQATEYYKQVSDLAIDEKDNLRAANLHKRLAFCFYRASFQAKTSEKFVNKMNLAIITYKKALKFFQKSSEINNLAKTYNFQASISLSRSWIEPDPSKKEKLIDDWWELNKKALKIYEESGDYISIVKTSNDLLMNAIDHRLFWIDFETMWKEYLSINEKALSTLPKIEDNYERVRTYNVASFYNRTLLTLRAQTGQKGEIIQKCEHFSKKALNLSKKTENAYLIYEALVNAASSTLQCEGKPALALEYTISALKHAEIIKDNNLLGRGKMWTSWITPSLALREEDPEKQRLRYNKSLRWAKESIDHFKIIGSPLTILISHRLYIESLSELASLEINHEHKRSLLKEAVEVAHEFFNKNMWQKSIIYWTARIALIPALYQLSKTEIKITEKRRILEEALEYNKKLVVKLKKILPFFYLWRSRVQSFLALVQTELAKIEPNKQKKILFLKKAVSTMETCLEIMKSDARDSSIGWTSGLYGKFYYWFGDILNQLYTITEKKKSLVKAIEIYTDSINVFRKTKSWTYIAESHWQIAKLQSSIGEHNKATNNYNLAAKHYRLASEKIPQFEQFYNDFSKYMQAWSQIEQARYAHSIDEYDKAKEHYKKSAELHESTEPWSYLTSNYFAWASVEEAESLSRQENSQKAKITFQKALDQFGKAEYAIKKRIKKITSSEEKEMNQRLLESSDVRSRYCQARILLEDAKLLDKRGKFLQSSKNYGMVTDSLDEIIDKIESGEEKRELELIKVLSEAWEKMAIAQGKKSTEYFLEAAKLFENAKDFSSTEKTSLWALGNSSFCKGLAAGLRYKNSMDLKENTLAKRYIKDAATNYQQAGFLNASEYAKATLRLFDAYTYMNQAESEVNPEKKAKQYQMAENLLQIAAGCFMKAKQPEKTAQVQKILVNVKEEKALAVSLNEVMQAPTIASTTMSFAAPTPTKEASVGLESFEHANVQANLVSNVSEVKVGESFCLSIEFVNAGREPALLTRVEDFVSPDFVVVKKPKIYRIEETCLNMKGKQIAPLKLVEVKLTLQPSKKGNYQLNPRVHYLDELGQNNSLQLKTLEIKVEEVLLEDRVSTGTQELDSLLLGGVPEGYAVVLTGPPSDKREGLIRNFREAGIKDDEVVFYVSTEADGLEHLLEKPNFYLFLCNPKPKTNVPDLSNIFKLRSKTDLTNLSISLAKAYRNIKPSSNKRVCIGIVSDVLLDYGSRETRKWISELIADLGSKGFTMLAVIDPLMHTSEELHAILGLFDGEISLIITKDPMECKTSIRVEKLRNQDYIKNSICLI